MLVKYRLRDLCPPLANRLVRRQVGVPQSLKICVSTPSSISKCIKIGNNRRYSRAAGTALSGAKRLACSYRIYRVDQLLQLMSVSSNNALWRHLATILYCVIYHQYELAQPFKTDRQGKECRVILSLLVSIICSAKRGRTRPQQMANQLGFLPNKMPLRNIPRISHDSASLPPPPLLSTPRTAPRVMSSPSLSQSL